VGHTPTVAGDLLFIGSCGGTFYALDRRTGQVRWATDLRPERDTKVFQFHGDPLITDKLVIVGADGTSGGGVHALDRFTGKIRWKYPAGRGVVTSIVIMDHHAYAYTLEGQLICLDMDSGLLRWSNAINAAGYESPTIIDGRIFAGDIEGNVYALDCKTGKTIWRKKINDTVTTAVTVNGSDLYLGTLTGGIYHLRAEDGTVVSTFQLESMVYGKPLLTEDSLIVYLVDEKMNYHSLISVDLSLEMEHWRRKTPENWSTTRFLVWEDCVVVGTPEGEVIAYNLRDGIKCWSRTLKGYIRAIGTSDGTIYVGTREGVIYAFDPLSK